MTAVSTGLGVLPFFVFQEPHKYYMGVSNAVAGGMMLAASYSLLTEAVAPDGDVDLTLTLRALLGVGLGIVFILGTRD